MHIAQAKIQQSTSLLQGDFFKSNLRLVLDRIALIARTESMALRAEHKLKYSQYFTEGRIAEQMAKMLDLPNSASIGDHGAGTGILGATVLASEMAKGDCKRLSLHAYEIDELLHPAFHSSLSEVRSFASSQRSPTPTVSLGTDFTQLADSLNEGLTPYLDAIIVNPPYKKLNQGSPLGKMMRANFVPCPNLYVVFIVLSILTLKPGGQLVAIIPRSFMSGPYFKSFRIWIRKQGSIDWIVRYKRRSNLFRGDNVLQENVTLRFTRGVKQISSIRVSLCDEPSLPPEYESLVPSSDILPGDSDMFLVPADEKELSALHAIRKAKSSFQSLGLSVSTGKLEDFRYKEFISSEPTATAWAPIIYPQHWGKPNSPLSWSSFTHNGKSACLQLNSKTHGKVIARGNYVLIKRISANDDRSLRCNATVLTEDMDIPGNEWVVDNHIQVISGINRPLTKVQATLLAEYLTSDTVDRFLRVVSGTTQLNKDDLMQIRFPGAFAGLAT